MSSIIAVGYLNSNGKLTNYNCLTTHQTQRLKIWIIRNWQSKTYTEDANRIPRSHYHKYFKNCQRDASPVLCRRLVEKDLFSLCLVIEGFWIIFLVKKFTIVNFLLRYEGSTLILFKELSSTIFSLWVSQSGIGNTCPNLHFLQYIKAWMSSTDPVSSITNYRLIVSYTDPVHSFIIS